MHCVERLCYAKVLCSNTESISIGKLHINLIWSSSFHLLFFFAMFTLNDVSDCAFSLFE